jgi:hypothetical protein
VDGGGLAFNSGAFTLGADGELTLKAGVKDQDGSNTFSDFSNFGLVKKTGPEPSGWIRPPSKTPGFMESQSGVLTLGAFTQFAWGVEPPRWRRQFDTHA